MTFLRRIFYISATQGDLDARSVKDIVLRAQRFNRQWDITGVLAHSGRHFAQVLEGRSDALDQLLPKIGRDRRHRDVRLVFDQVIVRRDYAEWSMGYLYDASLDEEIARLLSLPEGELAGEIGGRLAARIALHVGDLANP